MEVGKSDDSLFESFVCLTNQISSGFMIQRLFQRGWKEGGCWMVMAAQLLYNSAMDFGKELETLIS